MSASSFSRANQYNNTLKIAEQYAGTDYVKEYAEQIGLEQGIEILDPDNYYQTQIENTARQVKIYTILAVALLLLGVEIGLVLFNYLNVITKKGFRNARFKGAAVPVYAYHELSEGKLIVKAKDLNGKEVNLLTFKATPKNLSSLEEIIIHEDLQEETQ